MKNFEEIAAQLKNAGHAGNLISIGFKGNKDIAYKMGCDRLNCNCQGFWYLGDETQVSTWKTKVDMEEKGK